MGQEFCNGCQDCTNFKDFENNFNGIDYNVNNNNIETNNKKESSENNDEYYIFDSNLNKIMDNENNINSLDEEDKKRLEDIIKNNRAKKYLNFSNNLLKKNQYLIKHYVQNIPQ